MLFASSVIVTAVVVAAGESRDASMNARWPAAPDYAALAAASFTFTPADSALPTVSHAADAQDQPPASAPAASDHAADAASASNGPIANHHDNAFFHRGSWRWQISLGAATDFDDSNAIAGVGVSYFLDDEFTIDFELNGLYFDQSEGDNTAGINLAMLFRWHFWRSNDDRWSIYFDAGAGILFTGEDVPPDGTSFNFTPQAGMGFSTLINEERDARLLAGLRWYHISNANTSDNNPGSNRLEVYAGLNFPF